MSFADVSSTALGEQGSTVEGAKSRCSLEKFKKHSLALLSSFTKSGIWVATAFLSNPFKNPDSKTFVGGIDDDIWATTTYIGGAILIFAQLTSAYGLQDKDEKEQAVTIDENDDSVELEVFVQTGNIQSDNENSTSASSIPCCYTLSIIASAIKKIIKTIYQLMSELLVFFSCLIKGALAGQSFLNFCRFLSAALFNTSSDSYFTDDYCYVFVAVQSLLGLCQAVGSSGVQCANYTGKDSIFLNRVFKLMLCAETFWPIAIANGLGTLLYANNVADAVGKFFAVDSPSVLYFSVVIPSLIINFQTIAPVVNQAWREKINKSAVKMGLPSSGPYDKTIKDLAKKQYDLTDDTHLLGIDLRARTTVIKSLEGGLAVMVIFTKILLPNWFDYDEKLYYGMERMGGLEVFSTVVLATTMTLAFAYVNYYYDRLVNQKDPTKDPVLKRQAALENDQRILGGEEGEMTLRQRQYAENVFAGRWFNSSLWCCWPQSGCRMGTTRETLSEPLMSSSTP